MDTHDRSSKQQSLLVVRSVVIFIGSLLVLSVAREVSAAWVRGGERHAVQSRLNGSA